MVLKTTLLSVNSFQFLLSMMFVSLDDITQECIVSEFILTLTKLTHQRVCESLAL